MAETSDDVVVCPVGNDSSQPKTSKSGTGRAQTSAQTLIKPRGLKQISKVSLLCKLRYVKYHRYVVRMHVSGIVRSSMV